MDSSKVEAALDCPQPTTQKELHRFLVFANYSSIAASLNAFTYPKVSFYWSAAAEEAFSKLKKAFTSTPSLGWG